ncbi:c-type cytochrome [Methyloprofundus sp.]|uniref:c-type cytochrome n=1 Tax=Methyloprofundus sp. TaxID=2020875 RepID=UPI003D144A3C
MQINPNCVLIRKTALARILNLQILFWILVFMPTAYALHPISTNTQVLGVYPDYPKIQYSELANADAVKRGEYLVKVGDCIACHSNPKQGTYPFAGGLPIPTPFGTFFTPNITPDKKTGIGDWSEQDFIKAMHQGIRPDGSNSFPAFPYVYFNRIKEQDLKDIWAFLQVIPAVSLENKENTLPFIVDWRIWQTGWKALYFHPDKGVFKQDSGKSAAWNRGAYLVNGLGHCTMCHTPMNVIGAEQKKHFLTGSMIEGYWAPDITGLGLRTASKYQVAKVFRKSQLINEAGPVRGPMADANHNSLQYLTDADSLAIAEYLKSVVSKQPRNLPQRLADQPRLKRGEQVYANVCVICHLNGEAGAPRIGDQANWEQRLASSDRGLSSFYSHAINGFNKMPVKGACVTCNDADVTAAVDYLLYQSLLHSQWIELQKPQPLAKVTTASFALGEQVYRNNCSVCHDEGKLGAPKIGAVQQWQARIKKNMDVLILSTLHGKGNMPVKGGCSHCTGTEIIAAVKYLVQHSQKQNNYTLW